MPSATPALAVIQKCVMTPWCPASTVCAKSSCSAALILPLEYPVPKNGAAEGGAGVGAGVGGIGPPQWQTRRTACSAPSHGVNTGTPMNPRHLP